METSNTFTSPPSPATWLALLRSLASIETDPTLLRLKPWHCAPIGPDGLRDCAGFLARLELPHQAQVDAAAEHLVRTGATPPLPTPTLTFLTLRIETAILLCSLLDTADGAIPCPFPDIESGLRWLLISWWHQHGHRLACFPEDEP